MTNSNGCGIQPYLFFGGRCEEALAFYASAIGAQVEGIMRFSESPDPVPAGMLAAGFEKKVMHSSFRVGARDMGRPQHCPGRSTGRTHRRWRWGRTYAGEAVACRFWLPEA